MSKVKVLGNITIVCIILIIAICFPNIVSSYIQKSLEGKLKFVDVGVKTYEVKFNNIREKIFCLNKCYEEYGGELETIPIVTEKTEELKEILTQQVLQQFKKIQGGIVYEFPDFDMENLISCEKYAIYSADEANGISFWRLKYEKDKENIQIIMDAEFNFIYAFRVESKSKNSQSIIKKAINSSKMEELGKLWTENIIEYLELDLYLYEQNKINILPVEIYKEKMLKKINKDKKYGVYKTQDDSISETYSDNKNKYNVLFDYVIYIGELYKLYDDTSYSDNYFEKYDMANNFSECMIPIKNSYQYQKKERKLILDWGIGFLDNMIQP